MTNSVHYRIEVMVHVHEQWIDRRWMPIDKIEAFQLFKCYHDDFIECKEIVNQLLEVAHLVRDWKPVTDIPYDPIGTVYHSKQ